MDRIERNAYCGNNQWADLLTLSQTTPTPFVAINLDQLEERYVEFESKFNYGDVFYAMKANPHEEVMKTLINLGSSFDIASRYELDKALSLGAEPLKMSYGNTIKKSVDIEYFYEKGVRLFASDSEPDLRNIAKKAPGSKVYVRILTEGSQTAEWPLSRKFGCQEEMAYDLLVLAKELGLEPYGVSFHVGSQQKDIGVWDGALAKVFFLFESLYKEQNIKLQMINMGGGFPAQYQTKIHDLTTYAKEIKHYLDEDFLKENSVWDELPRIIIEPGRALVGNIGVLVSEVILISRKSKFALNRWIYQDCGLFGGLIETLGESIKYPVFSDRKCDSYEEAVIAGPTCDSMDIMYEDNLYPFVQNLEVGDKLFWMGTGAYTTSYSAIEFNGFPPLKTVIIPKTAK